MFQPRTGTAPDLGFITIFTLLFQPSRPTCFNCFSGYFYFLLPSYRLPTSNRSLSYHLSLLHPLLNSSPGAKHRPPGRCQDPHHVPASVAVLHVRLSPLCLPRPAPRSMPDPGGFSHHGYLCILVPPPHPPCVII